MVRLTFSNALEPLTSALARDIRDWRGTDLARLLCPLPIAIPDRLVARYLNLEIARQLGASVNLRFPFLSGVLESTLGSELRERLLTRERIVERVAIALGDVDLLGAPDMAPARLYIDTGDESSSAKRRAELALELTRLYLEYATTRPREFREMEFSPWQAQIWKRVTSPLGDEPPDAPPKATLVELLLAARDDQLTPPAVLFVVGASRTAPAHRLMLERLSRVCDVRVYAFNACREFWEDIEKSPDECPALAYWGRAGRSSIRQLSELANFDFEEAYLEPRSSSVLDRLKHDILTRQSGSSSRKPLSRDDSVKIISAPTIRRELEAIGEQIWTLVRSESDLSLAEIGVFLAGSDRDLYRAQVGSVFASLANLPHHVSLVPLTEESRVAEALDALIELPLGSFRRPEMLRVLTHSAVIGGDAEIDPADWVRWVRELGIFYGDDASALRGTYLAGDVYHWDQALLRLSLGACVERDPDERPVKLANRVVLPHPQAPDRRRSASRLALTARSLISDVTWLRRQSLPLSAWADVLWRFASAYIDPQSDRESAELGRCRSALLRMGAADQTAPVPMTTAIGIARASLRSLETRRGEPLTDGVCVAPLSGPPLVPFRYLFIAGLSSGTFPTAEMPGIDARGSGTRATEPSASDRDRYAFLHALLCARQRVTLSYVGRDPHSGETLAPSSVVAEFAHLAGRELEPQVSAKLLEEIPTWAHRDPDVESRGINVAARSRARAAELAPTRRQVRANRSRRRSLDGLRRRSPERTRALLGLADAEHERTEGDRELSAAELARFLDSPLDAWGRTVLGIGDPAPTERTTATEPLDLTALDRAIMMREAVCGLAIEGPSGGDLAERIDAAAAHVLLPGRGPSGDVAGWQIEAALAGAEAWWSVLSDLDPIESPTSLAIGRAREGASVATIAPALILGDDPFIETHGLFPLLAADGSAIVYFHRGDSPPTGRFSRSLVDHLLLAASGVLSASRSQIHLVGEKRAQTLEIDGIHQTEARTILTELARDLLHGHHAYELPGSGIIANHLRGKSPLDRIAELAAVPLRRYAMTIERRPGDFDLPDELEMIVERRYMPLLARVRRSS